MGEPFFSTLQGWAKSTLGADYAGRFMAQLIAQVSRVDPKPFQRFFAHVTKHPTFLRKPIRIEAEGAFRVGKRVRRADLVVYLDDVLRVLVELKYRDRLTALPSAGASQLLDYLKLCRSLREQPAFLLIHREPQEPEDLEKIEEVGQYECHYAALAPFLEDSEHPVSRMLLDYLKEEGLVIESIDTDHLYRFLHRLVLPWSGGGRINRTSEIDEGPMQFRRLLSNMRLLASDITPRLRRATRSAVARTATVDFELINTFYAKSIAKTLDRSKAKKIDVYANARAGGIVGVWAQNALASSPEWLHLSYGFEFHLALSRRMAIDAYALLESPGIRKASGGNLWDERFMSYGTVPLRYLQRWQKGDLESEFLRLIKEVARSTLKEHVFAHKTPISVLKRLVS